jgi:hypothetical protein
MNDEDLPGLSLDDPQFEEELDRRFNDGSDVVSWERLRQQLAEDLNRVRNQ